MAMHSSYFSIPRLALLRTNEVLGDVGGAHL
jgi:hypothetical protein